MSRSAVCAVVLLVIALVDFSSAGLLLANQTLKLDLACRAEKKTTLTCDDATINDLENALIAHLNDDISDRVPDKDCAFSLAGSTTCKEESIKFCIMLTCHDPRADDKLAEHIEQQQMAITTIMDRKTSESFSSGNSTAICRLFRDSDRRKTLSAICSEDCTKEYQGSVALCDCPSVEVPEPSCNIPAVLVHISKVTSINRTSCDQVDPSLHSAVVQQISELVSPIRFQGLSFQLAPGSVSTSHHCNSSSGLVHLNTLTSEIAKINTPFCSENISCIQEFNVKQLSVVKEFFLFLSSLMPQLQPVSVGGVQLSESRPNVNVQLSCENGTALNADGTCCFPGQCPRGSYIKDGVCRLCPVGQYTDEADQTQCQTCPGDQTTSGEGASDISYCNGSCLRGQYSPTGSTPCTPCPIGTHQRLPGQKSCKQCPTGYTTEKTGSTSFFDCGVITTTSPSPVTIITCFPPTMYPTVTIPSRGGFFASPNYPKNYTVLEKRTWTFQCPFTNQSAGLFILDLCLGSGDSLIIHNDRMNGPKKLSLSLPMMFTNIRGINIVFNSDARSTCSGFRIVVGCYSTAIKDLTRQIAFDCDVRKHVKNSSDAVINKIMRFIRGELAFIEIKDDPDFAPLVKASRDGSNPC